MEIKFTRIIDSLARVQSTAAQPSRSVSSKADLPGFETSRALETQLGLTPDVRQEKVATGRRLIGDPEYPPRETIQQIATLLALELSKRSTITA